MVLAGCCATPSRYEKTPSDRRIEILIVRELNLVLIEFTIIALVLFYK
jgi:hypothetical protein